MLFLICWSRGKQSGSLYAKGWPAIPALSIYSHISDCYAPFHAKDDPPATARRRTSSTGCSITRPTRASDPPHGRRRRDRARLRLDASARLPLRSAHPEPAERGSTLRQADTSPTLAPFIAGKIDEKLVEAHWDNLLRLAASVRTCVVSASLMLRRLGAYPRQNGLARALREVGRIKRTLLNILRALVTHYCAAIRPPS